MRKRGNALKDGTVGICSTPRRWTTREDHSNMEERGKETVWDRRNGGVEGHQMAWGQRPVVGLIQATCASSRVYSSLHDADETSASPSPGPSVLAQVGTSRHILLTFLTTLAFYRLLSASEVAPSELPCAFALLALRHLRHRYRTAKA